MVKQGEDGETSFYTPFIFNKERKRFFFYLCSFISTKNTQINGLENHRDVDSQLICKQTIITYLVLSGNQKSHVIFVSYVHAYHADRAAAASAGLTDAGRMRWYVFTFSPF